MRSENEVNDMWRATLDSLLDLKSALDDVFAEMEALERELDELDAKVADLERS